MNQQQFNQKLKFFFLSALMFVVMAVRSDAMAPIFLFVPVPVVFVAMSLVFVAMSLVFVLLMSILKSLVNMMMRY